MLRRQIRDLIREEYKDQVSGGLADVKKPEDFDPSALANGKKVEMEHTDDPDLAEQIAMDHLTEDPKYYDKLAKMEAGDKKDDEKGGRQPNKEDKAAIKAYLAKRPKGQPDEKYHEFLKSKGLNVPAGEALAYDQAKSESVIRLTVGELKEAIREGMTWSGKPIAAKRNLQNALEYTTGYRVGVSSLGGPRITDFREHGNGFEAMVSGLTDRDPPRIADVLTRKNMYQVVWDTMSNGSVRFRIERF